MIRLGALLLATLAGLFLILSVWGEGNPRADRRPAPVPRPAAQDAGAERPAAPDPQPIPAAVVRAESQTPERIQRFPGPALRPSPEHAGETPDPAPAAAEGPVLYVTADRVNVRAGPSTGDRVVAALGRGAAVRALGPRDAEWINIRDADGRVGYVAGRFLSAAAP
ncbi:SH3 domain-containing protein [Paracoccus sp. S3-43]|uniref:SH3 domain-containing protein n=1 Tax=Paracoccus sp. S3-43 TaxID=3030011 RepID=UPI0023B11673|nr:SH3 domain-containing protein [Paracoccus sp. S3-43]WEF25047.1 SH3 domain-containing protein [Paracoccus sp. S3-43]